MFTQPSERAKIPEPLQEHHLIMTACTHSPLTNSLFVPRTGVVRFRTCISGLFEAALYINWGTCVCLDFHGDPLMFELTDRQTDGCPPFSVLHRWFLPPKQQAQLQQLPDQGVVKSEHSCACSTCTHGITHTIYYTAYITRAALLTRARYYTDCIL